MKEGLPASHFILSAQDVFDPLKQVGGLKRLGEEFITLFLSRHVAAREKESGGRVQMPYAQK